MTAALVARGARVIAVELEAGSRASAARAVRRGLAPRSALYAADLVLPRGYVRRVEDGPAARRWAISRGLAVPRGAFRPAATHDAVVLVVRRPGTRVARRRRH